MVLVAEKHDIYNNSNKGPNGKDGGKEILPAGEKEAVLGTKVKELTETLQRLQAEFENYQKRSIRQNEEFKVFANARLIEDILPVLDSLENGMQHNKELVLIYEQLMNVLKKQGLKKINALKKMKFDHEKMECLMQESDNECREDEIVKVLLNGYELNGKILRPVKVSVSAGKKETAEKENLKKENQNTKTKENDEKNSEEKDEITKMDYKIEKMEFD